VPRVLVGLGKDQVVVRRRDARRKELLRVRLPWFGLNPMRSDAAYAVLATLPNYEARFAAIGSSQRLTQLEKAALYSRNYLLPKGRPL
jgi:hypothetical protein